MNITLSNDQEVFRVGEKAKITFSFPGDLFKHLILELNEDAFWAGQTRGSEFKGHATPSNVAFANSNISNFGLARRQKMSSLGRETL